MPNPITSTVPATREDWVQACATRYIEVSGIDAQTARTTSPKHVPTSSRSWKAPTAPSGNRPPMRPMKT